MATLDLSAINWSYLLVVFIGKLMVFVGTAMLIALLFYKRSTGINWGLCGLADIFVTQSNDVAFGLPIINVVYGVRNGECSLELAYL